MYNVTKIEINLEVSNKMIIMSSQLSFTVIAYAILMATKPKVLTKAKHIDKPIFKPRYHRRQQHYQNRKRVMRHYKGVFENKDTPLHHH